LEDKDLVGIADVRQVNNPQEIINNQNVHVVTNISALFISLFFFFFFSENMSYYGLNKCFKSTYTVTLRMIHQIYMDIMIVNGPSPTMHACIPLNRK